MKDIEEIKATIAQLEKILNEIEARIIVMEQSKHKDLFKDEIADMREILEFYRADLNRWKTILNSKRKIGI